jgi:hypothetical protein
MATEVPTQSEQSVTSLLSGIVSDIQDLIKQQMRLTRQEIETDLHKSKEAASFLAAGWAICYIALFAVCLMLAHLFHWLGAPVNADTAALPMWGSYALAAALFLLGGGVMIVIGRKKLEAIGTPLHETAQALKENIEWKTKTSPS